jgi:hypothetical protein
MSRLQLASMQDPALTGNVLALMDMLGDLTEAVAAIRSQVPVDCKSPSGLVAK